MIQCAGTVLEIIIFSILHHHQSKNKLVQIRKKKLIKISQVKINHIGTKQTNQRTKWLFSMETNVGKKKTHWDVIGYLVKKWLKKTSSMERFFFLLVKIQTLYQCEETSHHHVKLIIVSKNKFVFHCGWNRYI